MKLKITLYSVCLLMLLAACQQDGPTPEPSVGSAYRVSVYDSPELFGTVGLGRY